MPVRLTAFLSDAPVRRKIFPDAGAYMLGRSEKADLQIPDRRVSRAHARLTATEGGWRLEDLMSKNGTQLDGRLIDSVMITRDAWAALGGAPVLFEFIDDGTARSMAGTRARREADAASIKSSITSNQQATALLQDFVDGVIELSGCDRGSVWFTDDSDTPVLALRRGNETPPESLGAIRQVLQTGGPIITHDIEGLEAIARRSSVRLGGVRALACIPFVVPGATAGAVYADSKKPGRFFTELDLEHLHGLTAHAALTLASLRLRDQIAGFIAIGD